MPERARITITCNHTSSRYGLPVILDDADQPMDYEPGLTAALVFLDWTREDFAQNCGYKSARSVEKFWQGTTPPASTLNMLGVAIDQASSGRRSVG